MRNHLLAISSQLSVAIFKLWWERWNALMGLALAAVLIVIVEILEAIGG